MTFFMQVCVNYLKSFFVNARPAANMGAGIGVQETMSVGVRVKVPLPWVEALMNLFLLVGKELQQRLQ